VITVVKICLALTSALAEKATTWLELAGVLVHKLDRIA